MPNAEVIRHLVGDDGVVGDVDVANLLECINSRVELLYDRDHQVGHSFFIGVRSLRDLRQVFSQRVIPLLQEYFYGDWSKVCAVLGCPFNVETGEPVAKNPHPLISFPSNARCGTPRW